jgi:acyl-ACP thioesterase
MMCVSRLCGYFQEVAGKHATHLDVGYKFVQQSGKVWLLSRLYIRIKELPGWGQEFELQTWPLGNERIFYRRDYKVNIGTDTVITAISYWILLDLKTRRPTVIPIHEDVLKANDGLHSMTMPSHDFPTVSSGETDVRQVNYSDLDQTPQPRRSRSRSKARTSTPCYRCRRD